MKAAQITGYGGKEVIQLTDDAAKPVASGDLIVVEVRAAGINPFDWKVREGLVRQMAELEFPAILGGDFAGIVAQVGEGVQGLRVGDEVYGQAGALSSHGSFAEFVSVKAASVALKPKTLDFIHAAAAPLTAASAYQALIEHLDLQNGQKILIHGGAGGIGTFAVQLAKHLGAYVATTATDEGIDYVKKLGADEIIDYRNDDFTEHLRDYDAVFDTVGGETFTKSYSVLKQGGKIVSMVEQPNEEFDQQHGVTSISQFTRVTAEKLHKIAELIDGGVLTIHIDKTFPLEQAGEALDYLHEGKHQGRIVLAIQK